MAKSRRLLPDEWATALHSLVEMHRSGTAVHRVWSNVLGFSIPFGLGMWFGLWAMPELVNVDKTLLIAVAAGVLAYCAILIGFGATLMLFTGRIDRPTEMPLEMLRSYVTRIRYLLSSQGLTLFVALTTALAALAWTIVVAVQSSGVVFIWLGAIVSGLTAVSLARTALLPLQIFELHEAWLQDALNSKEEELRALYAKRARVGTDDE